MRSRLITLLLVILTLLGVGPNAASAVTITALPEEQGAPGFYPPLPERAKVTPRANIPEEPVHMFIRRGERSRFELFFLDVKYDYDVRDFEFYNAWCLEKDKKIATNALHQVRLYNYSDPDLPPEFKAMPWDQINYIINHKEGSKSVIQDAIWYLADNQKKPKSPEAMQLIEKAALKGKDYQPGEGELVAIICRAGGKQAVFIEFPLPEAEVVEAFPVSYAPPPPMPELSSLPLWLPLAMIPIIPPFLLGDGSSSESSSSESSSSAAPTALASSVLPASSVGSPTTPASPVVPAGPVQPPVNPPPAPITEPSSMLLVVSGLVGWYTLSRFKKRK